MRLKRLAPLAIVPVLVGAAMPVFSQTLADLAKKEEERRKKISEPAKVYTNKDLAPVPASSTPPPAPSSTSGAPAASTPAKEDEKEKDQAKEPVKDQKYWAGRMKALQETLTRDEGYAEAMQTRLNSLQTDFVNRDDPAQRAVIERDRNKVQAELERLKKAVVDEKKAIDDFMEEARRAGVPPGWLR
jgi:DNA repair exonuclease SbcCD ATPase subunit